MSDYNAICTYQFPDWQENNRRRDGWRHKHPTKEGHMPNMMPHKLEAPLLAVTYPNPLSMELRIVLCYLWTVYNVYARERLVTETILLDVRNICYNLFSSDIHIHSELGCSHGCPIWDDGYQEGESDN